MYVDDLVIIDADLENSCVKSQWFIAFEMKDLGRLHCFLGIEVTHIPDDILLTQRHYVFNMLYKFGMKDHVSTKVVVQAHVYEASYICSCLQVHEFPS